MRVYWIIFDRSSWVITWIYFYVNNVKFKNFSTTGIPYLSIGRMGDCYIEKGFKMNNGIHGNPIGRSQPCIFAISNYAKLTIGKDVGMSSTAIVVHERIEIGDRVKIGGGVCIYDTDFHSLDHIARRDKVTDMFKKKTNLL